MRPDALRAAISRAAGQVAMVSVMWANNEVGTVQPVAELAAVAHEYGIPFHTDAVQAAAQLPVDFRPAARTRCPCPRTSWAAGRGRGADPGPRHRARARAARRRAGTRHPLRHAGYARDQGVRGRRRGLPRGRAGEAARLAALRDDLVRQVLAAVPDAVLNGPAPGPGRLPGNAHFSFPGCEGDALLMLLDANGIACSTGSACTAGVAEPSHVLLAMGADDSRARGSLRFSLGHTSSQQDVDALAAVIGEVTDRARRAGAR